MSGINFPRTFGTSAAPAAAPAREKALLWLNVGYVSDVKDEDGTNRFVSLPLGIPVDSMEALPTNSRNQEYAMFQQARNDLLAQIMEVAKGVKPGEAKILNLQIQLRRVNDESASAPVPATGNPFALKIAL